MVKYIFILSGLFFIGCQTEEIQSFSLEEIALESTHGGEPNLFVASDSIAYISWVEFEDDSTDVLKFSVLQHDAWSKPKEISRGTNWFVNWADFPSLIETKTGKLSSHWLQKSASGTYDYDVKISQSEDKGSSWTPPLTPHRDSIAAEHGFVSLVPTPDGGTFVVWLDGRNTKEEQNNAMTLRCAEITDSGEIVNEEELDNRVCDCCQTATTWTKKGPIVAYRDRSEKEIRDISIVRRENGTWTSPKTIYNDNWEIAGCPVNGPSIESIDSLVVVAWFTSGNKDEPEVLMSISNNYGMSFGDPIRLDESRALGRVDIAIIANEKIAVSWMEESKSDATVKLCILDRQGEKLRSGNLFENSADRNSGFHRIATYKSDLLVAWTSALDSLSIVKTAKISFNETK